MKLAIIDLDGIVANADARFAKAEEAKQAFIVQKTAEKIERFQRTERGWSMETVEKQATNLYWQIIFNPENVSLDTLIEGANDVLCELDWEYEPIIILTSRPDSMRQATLDWLVKHTIFGQQHKLIMKAPAFQYTKTTVWKAGMVETLAALYEAETVMFIDDEEANIEVVTDTWNNDKVPLLCYSSLELAVKDQ